MCVSNIKAFPPLFSPSPTSSAAHNTETLKYQHWEEDCSSTPKKFTFPENTCGSTVKLSNKLFEDCSVK